MAVVEKREEVAEVAAESQPAKVGDFRCDFGLPAFAGLVLVQEDVR